MLKVINKKGLNNKGFTLIELLAVVVILAVVMSIAITQVLSAMNNSRKGSLEDSAKSVAQAFQTKYAESLVMGGAGDVYGDVLGTGTGFNFNKPATYSLVEGLSKELNLSTSVYALNQNNAAPTVSNVTKSFVQFDGSHFVVCLVAQSDGSYYVNTATTVHKASILNTNYTFANDLMWACSTDKTNSWT